MRSITAKLQAVFIRLIILVLMLFMVSIGLRFMTRYILVDRLGMDNAIIRLVLWDRPAALAQDRYSEAAESDARTNVTLNTLEDIHRQYSPLNGEDANKADTYVTQQLMFRRPNVEAANSYEKVTNWNPAAFLEYNDVYDLGNGYLVRFWGWFDVWENVEAMLEFKEYLDARNLPLLFVQVPYKIPRQDTVVNNKADFKNDNADRLVEGLREYGVSTLDLRDYAEQENTDYLSMFYDTDHHWRTETALWATGIISEELNRNFGFSINTDLFNPVNYHYYTYEKAFLGSYGKRVTLERAAPEDFTLIYPKFDVDLTLKNPAINFEATGDFDVIIDYSKLDEEDLLKRDLYAMYLNSVLDNPGIIQLENNFAQGDAQKVLLLGDSYCYTIMPYLGLEVDRIDNVDLRFYTGDLKDLIAAGDYDMVIAIYWTLLPVEYESGFNMYDFR